MVDAFLRKLDVLRGEIAKAGLERPREGTAFEYGRVVGLCEGIERAKAAILSVHDDLKTKDFD